MKRLLPLSLLVLAGCASTPEGPGVLVLPGSGRSFDQFRADDTECRRHAAAQASDGSQQRYDFGYQQCMYARGHKVPVAGRYGESREAPRRGTPVPPPPPNQPPPARG
jgi:hypothetical protein